MTPNSSSPFTRPTDRKNWKWFRYLSLAGFFTYLCVLIYFSVQASGGISLQTQDKILHYMAYGGLAGLMGFAFPRWPLWSIFIFGAGLGACLEIAQGLMAQGREASFADQLANMGGLLTAIIIWALWVLLTASLQSKLKD